MRLFQKNCSDVVDRLGFVADDYDNATSGDKEKPHLVLYHLSGDPVNSVEKSLPGLFKYKDAWVLCFKGSRLAGLAGRLDLVKRVERESDKRVHFLYFAVPSQGAKGRLLDSLQEFAKQVRASIDRVNWAVLDPEWPEHLLALYVALRALDAAGPGSDLEEALRQSGNLSYIIPEAKKEYLGLTDSKTLDLNTFVDAIERLAAKNAGAESATPAKTGPLKTHAEEIWEQIQPILL
jgi:hypothetical protein